jgi:hypothetical protein
MTAAYRCNLVIPGFPKSGTSSFHEYLALHPPIYMSRPREIHHFTGSDRWASVVAAAILDGLVQSPRLIPGLMELWSLASCPTDREIPPIMDAGHAWLDKQRGPYVRFYEEQA